MAMAGMPTMNSAASRHGERHGFVCRLSAVHNGPRTMRLLLQFTSAGGALLSYPGRTDECWLDSERLVLLP